MADHTPLPEHALAEYSRLPFPARTAALARLARALPAGRYEALRAALDAGGSDDRHTALLLAVARRDLPRVTAGLGDPLLRPRALAAAIRLPVPDEPLAALALTSPRAVRADVYRVLRRSRRHALADRLLPQVHAAHGEPDAARLLPACSARAVEQWLPRLALPDGVWQSLARTAPHAVADALIESPEQIGSSPRRRGELAALVTRRDPVAGLRILAHSRELVDGQVIALLLRRPADLLRVIRERGLTQLPLPESGAPPAALRVVRGLPAEDRATLAAVCRPPRGPGRMDARTQQLLALAELADRREIVEREASDKRAWRMPDFARLAVLEPADRARLAGALLGALSSSRPFVRSQLLALLPLPQAGEELRRLAGDHRHSVRLHGWSGLITCAVVHGEPAGLAQVLGEAERAWHDRADVRVAVLRTAARIPDGLLDAVPLAVLRDATLTTVQSGDSTEPCLEALARWLTRTARRAARDPGRASAVTALLVRVLRHPRCAAPVRPLRLGREAAEQVLAQAGPKDRALAAELLELDDPAVPRLWLRPPATREERCAGLLAADPASAAVPEVWAVLARRRTDLLGPALTAGHAPSGAATGRWLAADRAAYQRLLTARVLDEDAPLPARVAAARGLRDRPVLERLIADAPQPVAAGALTALAAGPPAERLPLLVGHLDAAGVRGRAAMAAVRRLLGQVPDGEAAALLAGLLCDDHAPVGIRKEAARASEVLPPGAAHRLLAGTWDRPGLHRDVRAVVAEALVAHVDRPGVADRLLAGLAEPAVAQAVLAVGPGRLPVRVRPSFVRLLARAMREPGCAQAAFEAVGRWGPVGAEVADAVEETLLAHDRPERVWRAALQVFASRPADRLVALRWPGLVARLAADAASGSRPAMLRLAALSSGQCGPDLAPELLDLLVDPLTVAGLPGRAAEAALGAAVGSLEQGELSHPRWERCLDLLEARPHLSCSVRPLAHLRGLPVHPLLALLRARGSLTAGLLAVALLRATGELEGPEVEAWRAHPDPDVAEAALLLG